MLTKEDLLQIGELLEPINKRLENMATKQDVKEVVEVNNRVLGAIFKVELAETNKRVDAIVGAVKAGFQETTKQIKQVEQKLDKTTEDHEERITRLAAAADLTHKN